MCGNRSHPDDPGQSWIELFGLTVVDEIQKSGFSPGPPHPFFALRLVSYEPSNNRERENVGGGPHPRWWTAGQFQGPGTSMSWPWESWPGLPR